MRPAIVTTLVALAPFAAASLAPCSTPPIQDVAANCTIDLARVGQMEDVLSNALMHAYRCDGPRVRTFLTEARKGCADGPELLRKAAAEFGLEVAHLDATVERFRHVNCTHPHDPIAELVALKAATTERSGALPLTAFAVDVTLHVVLHEIGHALVREFDLPVLDNEETLADAFATHYLVTELPERAPAVLRARIASLLHEAEQVPRAEWAVDGEHDNDARRAYQIAAVALAADRDRYEPLADLVGMSADGRGDAVDYGAEIHRSWRRALRPLWMPDGRESNECRVVVEESVPPSTPFTAELIPEIERTLRRFDWHSMVQVAFTTGDGGAAWNRSKRTVTVHSGYVQRFVQQGAAIEGK
jgi:hypothetical protein